MVIHGAAHRLVADFAHCAAGVVLGVTGNRGDHLRIADLLTQLRHGRLEVTDLLGGLCENSHLVLANGDARGLHVMRVTEGHLEQDEQLVDALVHSLDALLLGNVVLYG